MPGVMTWEEMNWLLPDFDETGLIYHGGQPENLDRIFQKGLIPKFSRARDGHETIYDSHYRNRPKSIPDWVDPRRCIFGFLNRARQGGYGGIVNGKVNGVTLGIAVTDHISERTWTACVQFSDMVYCPEEAGYFDTEERKAYFKKKMEPVSSKAYWTTSLSFRDNLKIRLDHLLPMQGHHELLICSEVDPGLLSLQGFRVKGENGTREVVRNDLPEVFLNAEERLRNSMPIVGELEAVGEFCRTSLPGITDQGDTLRVVEDAHQGH